MRKIQNLKLLYHLYEREGLAACFSTTPCDMCLLLFEKGELLSQPLEPLTSFLFLVQGSVRIFGMQQDSRIYNVYMAKHRTLLGDMEFCGHSAYPFFVEAVQTVLCIDIPFESNRAKLQEDLVFLKFMIGQLASKLELGAKMELIAQSLEERVVSYLRDEPDHTLKGVNQALVQLHCSRRQLQRVLKKMCDDGRMEKKGRGYYQLKI